MAVKVFVNGSGDLVIEKFGYNDKKETAFLSFNEADAIDILGTKHPLVIEMRNQNKAKRQQRIRDLEDELDRERKILKETK